MLRIMRKLRRYLPYLPYMQNSYYFINLIKMTETFMNLIKNLYSL